MHAVKTAICSKACPIAENSGKLTNIDSMNYAAALLADRRMRWTK